MNGVSFTVEAGRILGLLGPNGAGKTTAVSMVSGILAPDAGQVLVNGRPLGGDADAAKGRLGLVPQDVALYDDLSALDNLRFFGSLQGMGARALETAAASALEMVGLADRARDKVKVYSGGMKRRLNLAAGLLHDPAVLLLDEPTVGVDPQSRNAIFDTLEILRDRGKAILYTTHYMEEAERLCDRIIIMDHGEVIASDTLEGLQQTSSHGQSPPGGICGASAGGSALGDSDPPRRGFGGHGRGAPRPDAGRPGAGRGRRRWRGSPLRASRCPAWRASGWRWRMSSWPSRARSLRDS